jgi:ribulose-phosphate 3-epimerase
MKVNLGVKSDLIESRYSFDWLFGIMADCGVERLQYGSATQTYLADDEYFRNLRRRAERRGIRIASVFSTVREFGGFASGDPWLEAATRRMWERLIHVASLLGAGMAGTNASITMRDRPQSREEGIRRFRSEIRELMVLAKREGLEALTTEPMSSVWEYPSTPEEIRALAEDLAGFHAEHAEATVPFLYCGDISHGVADRERRVVHDNWDLFELEIPWMGEFHFKNTDAIFNSTFGFGPGERERGIIDLARLAALIETNSDRFPLPEVTGYLEIPGPKLGRDYADCHVGEALVGSLAALKEHFR